MFSRWVIALRIFLGWCCIVRALGQVVVLDLPTLGLTGYYTQSGKVQASTVGGPGQGYATGTRIEVTSPSGPYYSAGKAWNLIKGVSISDRCVLTFWARAAVGAPGKIRFKLQSIDSQGTGYIEQSYELDSVWRSFTWSFQAPRSLTIADGQLVLFLGDKAQTVDLAGVRLQASPAPQRIAGDLIPDMIPVETHGGKLTKTALNTGPDGTEASRFETVSMPDNVWEVQLVASWTNAVFAGDRFAGSCWVRLPPGGAGVSGVQFQFQRRDWKEVKDPWKTHAALSVGVDRAEWHQVHFQWVVPEDMARKPGTEAQVAVNLGFGPQVVELAGLVLSNLGKHSGGGVPDDFASYAGREETAPWRTAAAADIERYRKADYVVRARTESGSSSGVAKVRVRLANHDFGFGAAVKAEHLASQNAGVRARMRALVTNWVNLAVFENDLKWGEWENPAKQALTIESLDWLRQEGLRVRGHTLVWPIDASPAESFDSVDALEGALKSRVSAVAGHSRLQGRLMEWDVINEPTRYPFHVDVYEGDQGLYGSTEFLPMLADCFARVKAADPEARRVLNEFGILEFAGGVPARDLRLRTHLANLRREDPDLVQAVGLQAHMGVGGLIPPERLRAKLDAYESAFGLPIVITELDVNVPDESLRADYLRDFMTAAFSHPAVSNIVLWAWFDGSGLEHAGMFAPNGSLRSHAIAWSNLVHREWITEAIVPLDSQGAGQFRGFRGTYQYEALSEEGRVVTNGRVIPRDGILEIVVPDPVVPAESVAKQIIRLGNRWHLTFQVFGSGRFELQSKADLGGLGWGQLGIKTAARAEEITFDIPDSAAGVRFFRLAWLGP